MNLDLEKERQDFEQFRAWTLNHTFCGPSPTFQGYLESKITIARYDEMAAKASPACPHCHGSGYLPVFLPGDNIAVACVCVSADPRSSQGLALMQGAYASMDNTMMQQANARPKPLPVRFVRAQTRWGRFINWMTKDATND